MGMIFEKNKRLKKILWNILIIILSPIYLIICLFKGAICLSKELLNPIVKSIIEIYRKMENFWRGENKL